MRTTVTVRGQELLKKLEEALFEIRRVIAGQEEMLERVLVCLLAGGHLLIEGVPGLAKTLTIKSTASVLGGSFKRVQFTPDLVPSDLVGTRVFRPDKADFDTELGPVFCNFLLADEINRAPAKVQSALLEVMQERQVTIGHNTYIGSRPVPRARDAEPDRVRGHVSAAGGAGRPLHAQGARRLPGARRGADRRRALARAAAAARARCSRSSELKALQAKVGKVYVDPALDQLGRRPRDRDAQAGRARRSRRSRRTSRTARARAARSASIAAARALALLRGRDYVLAGRRRGARPRRVPAPARPLLPGARGGGHRRPGARRGARAVRRAADRPRPRRRRGGVKGLVAAVGRERTPARPGPGLDHGREPRALELAIGRRVDGLLAGDYRSAFAGVGSELLPGAAVRGRATTSAGSTGTSPRAPGTTHVRVELAERVLVTWLVFDSSASMAFGTADRRKADVAEGVALAVGHAATRRGNRLGLVAFGAGRPALAPAAAGPPRPAARRSAALREDPTGNGSLGEALRCVDGLAVQRSLVVDRLRLPRPDRLAPAAAARRRPASDASRSRSATRASRSSPTSASCGSSIPRPAASCASTRATAGCASASRRPRPRSATGLVRMLSSAGVRHVALSTEGDWLRRSPRSSSGATHDDRASSVQLQVAVAAAVPARSCRSRSGCYVWLERRRERRRARSGRRPRCCRTWSRARPGARRYVPAILFVIALIAAARRLRAARGEAHRGQGRRDRRARDRRLGLDGREGRQADPAARGRRGDRPVRRQAAVAVPRSRWSRSRTTSRSGCRRPTTTTQLINGAAEEDPARGDGARRRARRRRSRSRRRRSGRASRASRIRRRRSCSSRTAPRTRAGARPVRPPPQARKAGDPDLDRLARHGRRESSQQTVPLGTGTDRPARPAGAGRPDDAAGRSPRRAAARSSRRTRPTSSKQVYKDLGHRLVYTKKNREITVGVTLAALVLILAGAVLSGLWFRRLV